MSSEEPLALGEALGEIRTAIATLTTQIDLLTKRWDPVITDHETRIRKLEQRVWIASGAAAAVTWVISQVLGPILGG